MRARTFSGTFESQRNGLNLVRLVLALSVIVFHSFPLTGTPIGFAPAAQLMGSLGVDGFFAISGYLIVQSWINRPHLLDFLRARILRIFPAFWVCLIVTAAVFAPLSLLIRGAGFPTDFLPDAVGYVVHNSLLRIVSYGITGTPQAVPFPGVWDGALWTLFWEFLCYLGVLLLGLTRLLQRRFTLPLIFLGLLLALGLVTMGLIDNYWIANSARFGIMFVSGALIRQFKDRIPVAWPVLVGAAVLILASAFLPDYRLIASLPIAYLVLTVGALAKHPRMIIRNDLSYGVYIYGFPVAQLLATAGAASLGVPVFAILSIVCALPMAAASWFLIEKQALRLKGKRRAPNPVSAGVAR